MSRLSRFVASLAVAGCLPLGFAGSAQAASPPPTVWGCFPGISPNPCEGSLATTYLSSTTLQPRRVAKVETPLPDADRGVDCFYVYPTVSGELAVNASKRVTDEVRSIYRYQAARFSQVCKVYAPVYRQATLAGIIGPALSGATSPDPQVAKPLPAFDLAYGDVLNAWNDYLANHNRGRGVVLIGHSQGSGMLIRLMREQIDGNPAQRKLLVSAIVPGGNMTVAAGRRTGGDLTHIPTCESADEIGCAIAYSAYADQPRRSSLFGRAASSLRASTGLPTRPGDEVVCVNPAELSGDGGRLRPLTRSEPFSGLIGIALTLMYYGLPPKASTPWISPGERYSASCERGDGAHVLRVRRASAATILPLASPTSDWGLHLADVNLPLENLVTVVRRQASAYAAVPRTE